MLKVLDKNHDHQRRLTKIYTKTVDCLCITNLFWAALQLDNIIIMSNLRPEQLVDFQPKENQWKYNFQQMGLQNVKSRDGVFSLKKNKEKGSNTSQEKVQVITQTAQGVAAARQQLKRDRVAYKRPSTDKARLPKPGKRGKLLMKDSSATNEPNDQFNDDDDDVFSY